MSGLIKNSLSGCIFSSFNLSKSISNILILNVFEWFDVEHFDFERFDFVPGQNCFARNYGFTLKKFESVVVVVVVVPEK